MMGWRNSFSWKGLTLGCLINARVGGVVVSQTQAMMDAYGVSKATATARDLGYVLIDGHKVPGVQKYYSTVGSGTHFSGMDYFMLPSLRNLGFSVKLNF